MKLRKKIVHAFRNANASEKGFTLIDVMVTLSLFALLTTVLIASYPDSATKVELANEVSDIQGIVRSSQLKASAIETNSDPAGGYGLYFDSASTTSFVQFKDLSINGSTTDPTQLIGNSLYDGSSELTKTVGIPEGFYLRNICVGRSTARPFDQSLCSRTNPTLGSVTIAYSRTTTQPLIFTNNSTSTRYLAACVEIASVKGVDTGKVRNITISESGFSSTSIGACDEVPQSIAVNVSDATNNSSILVDGKTIYGDGSSALTLTLNGSSTMEVIVGDTFVDPGATANDTLDGDVSSKITSSVQSVTTYTQPSYFSYATSNSSTTVWSFKKDSSNNYITNSYSELMKYNSSGGNIFSIPKLSAPQGIVTDSYGNIFVEGQNSQNIIKINSSGTSTLFGSLTAQPIAIAIDSSDNLYVLDYSGNLKKWNAGPPGSGPSGSASTIATGICLPLSMYNIAGLAVDSSGNAYVPCTDNTVTKITSGGVKSTLGSASGTYPQGIVADGSGNIYTANYSSNNVTKRTQGGVTTILGTTGTHPKGITLDSYGNVYTVNDTNITKITTGGTSTTFGGAASSMLNQASIKVDSFGNIYVPQANSTYTVNTIFKVTQSGATSTFANTGVNPVFLAMDSAENLYVSNYLSSTITKVAISYATSTFATTGSLPYDIVEDTSGNIFTANRGPVPSTVTKITPGGVSSTFATLSTSGPYSITIDSANNLYLANNTVAYTTKITSAGASSTFGSAGTIQQCIVLDQANNIYIARPNGHAVYKITQSGTTTSFSGDLGSSANCLAVDSSGNMYTNLANNTVVKITSGGATSTLSTTGSGTVGIAVDQNGNVYTANFSSNNITKITSGGVSSLFGTTISSPYAVKIGYDGSVFVSSSASNNVTRISPSGTSYTLGTTGSYPDGILISRSGDIYTANRNSNNVTKISKVGTPTTFGQYTGVLYGGSYDFASDTSGNIYTADKDSYSISKIDTSGNVSLFTTTGVYKPYYMISDASNNLYYSAQSSSLTFSLMKSTSVGATSTLASPAPSPARLARDSQGNIYMPDSSNNLVLKVSSIGATSSIKGIYQPTDITIDSSDNVYVKNSNTGYVTKVTPAGATTTYLTGATITGSIVTDSLGAVYTANNGNVSKIDNISGKPGAVSFSGTTNPKDIIVKSATSFLIGLGLGGIMKVDLGGAPTTVSTTSISTSVPSDYIILYKVKNSSGNIAMAQRTVKVIYPKIIDRYIPPTVNNVIQNPASIVFDSNNNMYFTGNCNVFKVDSGTNALSLVYTGSSNCGHGVLAVDTSDNVYLAQYPYMMSSGTIIKITPAGSASTFANLGLQPAQQADLLKDSSGNLYSVVGSGAYKITTGGVVTSFTIDASDQVVVATMDNLNNLYVGYRTDGKVFKRTSGGATSTVYTAGSQMLGMVSNNVTGDVYVLEAQKITKITALGGVSTVATVSDSFGTGLSFGDSSSSMLFTSNYKIDLTTGKTYSIGNLNYSSVIWIKYNAIDNKLYMATNSESSVLKLKIH